MTRTLADVSPELGQRVDSLDTPVVVVDLDVMERNIRDFMAFAETHDVGVRSHTKAHKIPDIARRQEEPPGSGVLCQKLSEAEVMARHGVTDILLVCPVVTPRKLERLLWLSRKVGDFSTVVDCPGNAEPLQRAAERRDETVDVVMEVDVGLNRMGPPPGEPAVELGRALDAMPNLNLVGILGHDGHVKRAADSAADYERICRDVGDELAETVEMLAAAGIEVADVITGATATAKYIGQHPVVTEIDPGRYVFNDVGLLDACPTVTEADCALKVVTTVVSTPTEERAIVDAGAKTLSYSGSPTPRSIDREGIDWYKSASEHGYLDVSRHRGRIEVGDRLEFLVPNAYGAINLRDTLVGVRDGHVEEVWNVEARGKDT
jgi:D-serine deaminase-like pyridoxal phosphate-dependent protein